jgi:anhydro-N-acetylmuramic acid kinase
VSDLFIGLMSGTSLDGVDGVLVRLAPASPPQVLAAFHADYPGHLREAVLGICAAQAAPLSLLGRVDVQIARLYADVVGQLLAQASLPADAVRGIGSHGQTVHHEPQGDTPFTMQLGDPNLLAARTGITVVADFRRRDMALGGQGAPLAPGFHEIVFRHPSRCRVVLNTGGIANISVLAPAQPCIGYDTGPANILMDAWMQSRHGVPFDEDGRLARQGAVDPPLLARLLADPYFALPPPKSTGREHFNIAWIEGHLAAMTAPVASADVQRTLLELTAVTVSDAIARHAGSGDLLVAGGGAHNPSLLERLQALNPAWQVATTASVGVPPEQVEAIAFAVFAQRTLDGLPGNLPAVTGASRPCVLGGVYAP